MTLGTYRTILLAIGDVAVFWASLVITLFLRYGADRFNGNFAIHILPFGVVFAVWILVFYIIGLYEVRIIGKPEQLFKYLTYATLSGGIIAIALFYFVPAFTITPRINLILDIIITFALMLGWRSLFAFAGRSTDKIRVLLVGSSPDIDELARTIEDYPHLGYIIKARCPEVTPHILNLVSEHQVDIVVASKENQTNDTLLQALYEAIHRGIRFVDVSVFYEMILGRIPVSLISKVWFLENIAEAEKLFFEISKRAVDILFALILVIPTTILMPFVAVAIRLNSQGPIFIRQKRIGRMGKSFTLLKYRTMLALSPDGSAETRGAEWSQEGDKRITGIGKILRSTRIDELPQVWNILRGDLSFIGPRPERPEFVENLRKDIPYYDMRHLVRPGLSGWAQINPPYYYASHDDTILKLQYDLYYIKNRDLGLDLSIALKTLMVMLSRQGR
ncbi:MAG: sugar transferase [Patescibacteria group bacterium]